MAYSSPITHHPSLLLVCACLLAAAMPGAAEEYPSRPVRMLLPQAPGSTTDTVGRIVFAATAVRLNQQLVVDNRPGAGGTMGMEIASRAAPDGYTLVGVAASMLAIAPHVYRKLAYDPLDDFVPVGLASMTAVAQGESDFTVVPLSAGMAQVRTGRIRCLATGGDKRTSVMPELPTLAESGVPGFRLYGWNGVVAPRGTPRAVILKFNRAMNEALDSAEVRTRYLALGEEPSFGPPEAFGKLIREDYEKMGKLVKQSGIRPE